MRALNSQCMSFHSIQHLCILFISSFFEFSVPRCLCRFIYLYSSIYGSGTTDTFLSLDSGMDKFSSLLLWWLLYRVTSVLLSVLSGSNVSVAMRTGLKETGR
ncbi:hypothetical protein BP00DRAFT_214646 [Aspergillus indologenus CBS 114.80]|uniref:Uncharacterized protein n=1 Tax=Aspergillus indologenus CBS 114.80 TaxID=1450541 RepID=A0A2V5I068_9EURO|nr:hypothetical protein BP00DRAFT_214646 [Aspergillus indologenus CBS 114.80]